MMKKKMVMLMMSRTTNRTALRWIHEALRIIYHLALVS